MKTVITILYALMSPVRLIGVVAALIVKSVVCGYKYTMDKLEQYW